MGMIKDMKKPFYSKGNKVILKDQDILFKIKIK